MPRVPARCALPGCDAIIDGPAAGAVRQRYCSAAHRVSARQQRRTERISAQADRAAEPVEEPVEVIGAVHVVAPPRRAAEPTREVAQPRRRPANRRSALRRRAIAVLGVASVLAAGQQLVGMERNPALNPPGGLTARDPVAPDVQADRATVERGLVLVNAQLDMIAQAMDQWRQLHGTSTPPEVLALMERQRVVEQLKATVVSKLAAMDTLERTAGDRTAAEQALAAIDHALSTTPMAGPPELAETRRQLADQKKMWTERRDQLTAANTAAQRAVAEPMPDVSDHTSPLTQRVLAITGLPAPSPADHERRPLAAIAPREHAAEEKPPVYTSAPPRPTLLEPDAPPSRDRSAGGDRPVGSAAGNAQTSTPASRRQAPPVTDADLAALKRAAQLNGPTQAAARTAAAHLDDFWPTNADHSQAPPRQAEGRPPAARSSGPATGGPALPAWAQRARAHLHED